MSDAELLESVIVCSGLSNRQFAKLVLTRDERALRRWMAGVPLPAELRTYLLRVESIGTVISKDRTQLFITLTP